MPSRQLRTLAAFVLVTSPAFAAHVTDVADAGDERHPLEVDIDVTYLHTRSETRISRERPGTAGTALVDELHHLRTVDELGFRLAFGLWHDLELHVFAPMVLRDVQNWRYANGVDASSSSLTNNRIDVSGCAAAGSCSSLSPIVPAIPGESHRAGFRDPTIGITWGPINEERELKLKPELFPEGKPVATWVIGFDYTLPLPGGTVDDPSRWGANSSDVTGTLPSDGSESRRAHIFTLWTAFSKRYRVLEPYVRVYGSAPVVPKTAYNNCNHPELLANVAAANCPVWRDQTGYKPPWEAGLALGTELVAAEDTEGDQRFAFDVRGDLRYRGPARDYTQVTDALGKLTYSDEYLTTMGSVGIYGRVARWLHFRVYGTVGFDTAHFLTHENVGEDKDNDGVILPGTVDQNPTYDFRLDQVGRRLRAEMSLIWGFAGTLSLNF
jgi:hypothetical protein